MPPPLPPNEATRFPCDHADVAEVRTHMFVSTMDERRWMIFQRSQPKMKIKLVIVALNNNVYVKVSMRISVFNVYLGTCV